MSNLFDFPSSLPEELTDILVKADSFRLERIISHGHSTPAGKWYDQDENEWVVILQGEARLLFEGSDSPLEMKRGDSVHIPAHRRHRVESTTPGEPTLWLALFYPSE